MHPAQYAMGNLEFRPAVASIYSLRETGNVPELNQASGVSFVAFATDTREAIGASAIEVYLGQSRAHFAIVNHALQTREDLTPVACGLIELDLPDTVTVIFIPSECPLTSVSSLLQEGLRTVHATDDDVINPVVTSVRRALSLPRQNHKPPPYVRAEVEAYW